MAITASFSKGVLSVLGDSLDNTTTISRNTAGTLWINNGVVPIVGGTATVANTTFIEVFGQGGNDRLELNESNGALPRVNLFGGAGHDTLIGGSGGDQLFGQAGNDNLQGKGGADFLFGGANNDILTGGDGDDQVFGEWGNDWMIWNPGDDNDLMEGGSGIDTVEVNGGNGSEIFNVAANGTRVRFDRTNPAPFFLDIGTSENLVANLNGGDDTFTAGDGLASLIQLTVNGGAGNDTIQGGDGTDVFFGGDGNDFIDGNRGDDVAWLGAGDDVFQWDPGDGSDVIEGQAGFDTMLFNGSGGDEVIDLSANGGRLRFFRNLGNITMDTNYVERVNFESLGGSDTVTMGDLSGTDVVEFNVNLSGTLGGTTGNGSNDAVILNGSNGAEFVEIQGENNSIAVVGLPTYVTIKSVEATDALQVNGNGGNDNLNASSLITPVQLTLDGGAGDDTFFGSNLADVFLGGAGNDFVDGNRGDDVAFLGHGDDIFVWDPGDGNDLIEGQAGTDELLFNGSDANENVDLSANGGRLRFFRDVANVVMDTDDVERITFNALGGQDRIVINDLGATDVKEVNINLGGVLGSTTGDGKFDQVIVNGSNGDNVVTVIDSGNSASVLGLGAQVNITGIEPNLDKLQINGLAGDDVLIGGAGNDVILGGIGDDVLHGGHGDDILIGQGGNDVLTGGAGADKFRFNTFAEKVDIITDFVAVDDTIQVLAQGFGGGLSASAAITADQFTLGSAAADVSDRFIYNTSNGQLFFDVDGTGAQNQVLLATLTGAPTITNADIVVI